MVMGPSFLDDFQPSLDKDHGEPAGPVVNPIPRPARSVLDRVIEGTCDHLAARWWCEAVFEGLGAA
jgi:hypothetical protein